MTYNCIIVGDSGVGKSTLITRYDTGDFIRTHNPTSKMKTTDLRLHTNHGIINFKIYENGHISNIDCAIIMFDLTNKTSYNNVINYYNWIITNFGNIPIVVCGNKSDLPQIIKNTDLYRISKRFTYVTISSRSNYNYEKPLLFLIRKLLDTTLITYNQIINSNIKFINQNIEAEA